MGLQSCATSARPEGHDSRKGLSSTYALNNGEDVCGGRALLFGVVFTQSIYLNRIRNQLVAGLKVCDLLSEKLSQAVNDPSDAPADLVELRGCGDNGVVRHVQDVVTF